MEPRHVSYQGKPSASSLALYDKWLLTACVGIVLLGLMMVASSSIVISEKYHNQPFYFLIRQAIYLLAGIVCSLIVLRIDSTFWKKHSVTFLLTILILLVVVLLPGIGRSVNGATRWIALGPISIQVSELAKLAMILYLASYLVRHQYSVRNHATGFIKPMIVLTFISALLIKEPDFGATVVIAITVMAMMFMAGVKVRHFLGLAFALSACLSILAISSPYRMARITAFLNPWADQFNSGYQLTQSLIAFGRGGWFGAGIGESVQKLFYLPEAHTDFVFAVLAEELGLSGIIIVLAMYSILIARGLAIARCAQILHRNFQAYVAYGLTFWLGIQTMINIGVNSGLLPTKGLTLPLMSYGGASMMVICVVIAMLLRIDHENRWELLGLGKQSRGR
jgi:cell division protein FtsW